MSKFEHLLFARGLFYYKTALTPFLDWQWNSKIWFQWSKERLTAPQNMLSICQILSKNLIAFQYGNRPLIGLISHLHLSVNDFYIIFYELALR